LRVGVLGRLTIGRRIRQQDQTARRPETIAKIATIKATTRTSQRKLLTAVPPATARMIKAMTRIQSSGIEGSFAEDEGDQQEWLVGL
jgi:hypothetical protein